MNLRAAVLLSVASLLASAAVAVSWPKHPDLTKAFNALENSEKALHAAADHEKSEFGGHRAKAEQLAHEAQEEVKQAVEWANGHK